VSSAARAMSRPPSASVSAKRRSLSARRRGSAQTHLWSERSILSTRPGSTRVGRTIGAAFVIVMARRLAPPVLERLPEVRGVIGATRASSPAFWAVWRVRGSLGGCECSQFSRRYQGAAGGRGRRLESCCRPARRCCP
jgi:hypothetical protein